MTELIKSLDFSQISSSDKKKKAKEIVANKKTTFDNAKFILSKIYNQTVRDNDETNVKWFKSTISDMVDAAYNATELLFDVMTEEVDFENSTIKDQENFSFSKKQAYEQVDSFSSSIEELETMLDSIETNKDNIKFKDEKDFSAGWAEKFHEKLDTGSKAGYDKETDSVVICPRGTKGKLVVIDGLRITLPKEPNTRKIKKRRGNDKQQFWEREAPPNGITEETAESFTAYIEKNHKNLREGFWFYNNGEAEYITGAHWLLLQWLKTEADNLYFDFRIAHRDIMYFWEAVWVDERCLGSIMGKSRRSGITHLALAFLAAKSTLNERNRFGQTSMTDTYASINFERLTTMITGLPFFMKPTMSVSGSKIIYAPPRKRTSVNNKQVEDLTEGFLANTLDYSATKEDSYDSTAQKLYFADELSKWRVGENITNHYDTVKSVLTKGLVVHGKMLIVSTVRYFTGSKNPDEQKNGDRYVQIYEDSRLETRKANGRTKSGLYKLFIPASENLEGAIDKYGYPVKETPTKKLYGIDGRQILIGADEYIKIEHRDPYKGDIQRYNQACREYPQYEEDMFKSDEDDGLLDVEKIDEEIDHNNYMYDDLKKKGTIKIFDLEWENGNFGDKVVRVEKSNGNFVQFVDFPEQKLNNFTSVGGYYKPGNSGHGAFGIDVYKFSDTNDGRGSNQAIHLFSSEFSSFLPKNTLIMRYLAKRPTVDMALEDVIKAMLYYSMPALIENNISNLLELMKRKGMRSFSIDRVDKSKKDLSSHERELGGQPTTGEKIKQSMLFVLQSFIDRNMGNMENKILDNTTLYDWRKLDGVKWTKNDASISSSLSLLAVAKMDERFKVSENKAKSTGQPLYKRYSHNGGVSKRIR